MIRSMTGFGRATFEVEGFAFTLEIRTVNHRHLDTRVRLPRQLSGQDASVKARVQQRLERLETELSGLLAP